ncbi:hypothetical protein [Schinkia azotoformans]|uniref:hypothetical protein n=1 Tax=Schinkia azotoformans TaxID=1454 RepID=UPI002DBDEE9D|nr:hypothetical protein [Schinkia azotoformans]MEC1743312.1 hypothetical protein [Schinkia azotoformans]MEC1769268.1 hypothetical protein [Schinkia azotoformans]MEC1787934.1 hypothetical protein [Schinkia azotoformans]MED4377354.1 hypothetical protein [Schinkia azotoformans]MED4420191.1 hypothetical protein [Schinkia azotoformans]
MIKKKKGLDEKYSDNDLKLLLDNYSKKHSGKITYLGLEKETGISRKTWKRRMTNIIERLNLIVISSTRMRNDEIPLPNFDLIIDRYLNDEKGLREALYNIQEVFIKNYDENHKLTESIAKKDKEINDLKEKIDKLKSELDGKIQDVQYYERMMVESTNPSIRRRKGIKNNLLKLDDHRKKSAASLELEEEFPELFGDLDE